MRPLGLSKASIRWSRLADPMATIGGSRAKVKVPLAAVIVESTRTVRQ
jgi:hypothetical protein